MRKLFLNFAVVLMAATTVFTSCEDKVEVDPDANLKDFPNEVIVKSAIKGTRNWVKDSVYILMGQINVEGTLNIAPGTVVKGDKVTKGTLVVVPGGKLNAVGTATQPIVFTSRMAAGARSAGDWGGVILVGKAPVNQSNATVEGLSNPVDYGTSAIPTRDENDSSGKLKYVRIEFSGIALQPDKETNGLTMCAVGKGTELSHIQVSFGGDDSFEWFGGNVNAKNLIAYAGVDDDWDVDYGYSGNVQFGVSIRNPRTADVSGSNGFESDNDGSGSAASPKTSAVFSNMTVIGPFKTTADKDVNANFAAGMHLRRNTSISIFNSVFAGWNTAGLLLDATTTYANATAGDMALQNVAIVGIKGTALKGAASVTDTQVADFFNTTAFGNKLIATTAEAGIDKAFYNPKSSVGTPESFLPAAGSPLLGAGAFANAKLQNAYFDKSATYMGAFGTTDWTKEGWVNFDPQNTVY